MDESTQTKACCRCGEFKRPHDFGKNAANPDQLQRHCKACGKASRDARTPKQVEAKRRRNAEHMARQRADVLKGAEIAARQREWFKNNAERAREYKREFRRNNPEKLREINARYYQATKAERAAWSAAYHVRNAAKIQARAEAWRLENPERYRVIRQRRRARVNGNTVGQVDVAALWTGKCGLCGGPLATDIPWPDPLSRSIDHIIPLSRGGTHEQSNLHWTHLLCNLRKGCKVP